MLMKLGTKDHYNIYASFEADEDGVMNPLENDQLWTLVGFGDDCLPTNVSNTMVGFDNYMSNRYHINTDTIDVLINSKHDGLDEDGFFDRLHNYLLKFDIFSEPISCYQHDSRTYSIGVEAGWDSGVHAIAVVSKKELRNMYEIKHVTKKVEKEAYNDLKTEIDYINDDFNGNLCRTIVKDAKGNDVTSGSEFYGSDLDGISDKSKKLDFALSMLDVPLKPYSEYLKQCRVDDYEGLLEERAQLKDKLQSIDNKIANESPKVKAIGNEAISKN